MQYFTIVLVSDFSFFFEIRSEKNLAAIELVVQTSLTLTEKKFGQLIFQQYPKTCTAYYKQQILEFFVKYS